jgi:acyl-coenzyme A thioesterase PaaI-like protein
VCGSRNPRWFGLQFRPRPDDQGVTAEFGCDRSFEGYPGVVHGGVVSALLDGAMTHCLFHMGHVGRTARLSVRFRQPVVVGRPATLTARLTRARGRVLDLTAEITQGGRVVAEAQGRFLA